MTAKIRIGIAALALSISCGAAEAEDPQRCTARLERVDRAWYQCVNHCMKQGRERMPSDPSMQDVEAAFDQIARCTDQCTARRDLTRAHAAASWACASSSQAHDACSRLLQRADPTYMRCRYHCASEATLVPGFDRSGCDQACNARDQMRMQSILARPACAGR